MTLDLLMKIQRRTDYLVRILQPTKAEQVLNAAIERALARLTPEEGQAVVDVRAELGAL
jgi:hypothetical protein